MCHICLLSSQKQSFVPQDKYLFLFALAPFPFSLILSLLSWSFIPCPLLLWGKYIFVLRNWSWKSWAGTGPFRGSRGDPPTDLKLSVIFSWWELFSAIKNRTKFIHVLQCLSRFLQPSPFDGPVPSGFTPLFMDASHAGAEAGSQARDYPFLSPPRHLNFQQELLFCFYFFFFLKIMPVYCPMDHDEWQNCFFVCLFVLLLTIRRIIISLKATICLVLRQNIFWGDITHTFTSPKIGNPQQTKTWIPPKSNLVNQCVLLGLPTGKWASYLEEQKWLKDSYITKAHLSMAHSSGSWEPGAHCTGCRKFSVGSVPSRCLSLAKPLPGASSCFCFS